MAGRQWLPLSSWILLVVITVSIESFYPGLMLPHDPQLRKGETLTVNCTLPTGGENETAAINKIAKLYNSSSLFFLFFNVRYNSTRIIDDRTAELRLENFTSPEHVGMFYCKAASPNGSITIGAQWLRFIYKPVAAQLKECVVDDWKTMICSWTPDLKKEKRRIRLKAAVEIEWKLNGTEYWKECPEPHKQFCKWPTDGFIPDAVYDIRLTMRTKHDVIVTNFTVPAAERVKPRRIVDLNVVAIKSSSVRLNWTSPVPQHNLTYRLTYNSKWSTEKDVLVSTESAVLGDLQPDTKYDLQISCIPVEGGHWSEPVNSEVQTPPDVPAHHPAVTAGSFSVKTPPHGQSCREVRLFWQELRPIDYNSPNKPVYEAHVRPLAGCKEHSLAACEEAHVIGTPEKTTWSTLVYIPRNCSVVATVTAKNHLGASHAHITPITIKAESELPDGATNFTAIVVNGTSIHLRWNVAPPDGAALRAPVQQNNVSYTVYWCLSVGQVCKKEVRWKTLAPGVHSFVLHADDDITHYKFAVSRTVDGVSSGMKWSTCIYEVIASPPPSDLRVSKTTRREHHKLTVEWESVPCHDQHGYIYAYLLQYWYIKDGLRMDETNVTVPRTFTNYTLTALTPHVTYYVRIASLTAVGLSSFSQPLEENVTRSWLTLTVQIVIGVCGILMLALCGCGIYSFFKNCRHCYERLMAKYRVERPLADVTTQKSVSSQRPIIDDEDDQMYLDILPTLVKQTSLESNADSGRGSLSTEHRFRQFNRSTSGTSDDVFTSRSGPLTPMANYVQVGLPESRQGLPLTNYSQVTLAPGYPDTQGQNGGPVKGSPRSLCVEGVKQPSPILNYVHVMAVPDPDDQDQLPADNGYTKGSSLGGPPNQSYLPHEFAPVSVHELPSQMRPPPQQNLDYVQAPPDLQSQGGDHYTQASTRPESEATSDYVQTPPGGLTPENFNYLQPPTAPLVQDGMGYVQSPPHIETEVSSDSLKSLPSQGKLGPDEPLKECKVEGDLGYLPAAETAPKLTDTHPLKVPGGKPDNVVPPEVEGDGGCPPCPPGHDDVANVPQPQILENLELTACPQPGYVQSPLLLTAVSDRPPRESSPVHKPPGGAVVPSLGPPGGQSRQQSDYITAPVIQDPRPQDTNHNNLKGNKEFYQGNYGDHGYVGHDTMSFIEHPETGELSRDAGEREHLLPLDGGRKVHNKSGYLVVSA